jgi:hypothetical protein
MIREGKKRQRKKKEGINNCGWSRTIKKERGVKGTKKGA